MRILNGNLLCKAQKLSDNDDSGLIIPKDRNYKVYEVLDFDSDNVKGINKGDVIYTPQTGGFEIEIDNDPHHIINIKEVILIA